MAPRQVAATTLAAFLLVGAGESLLLAPELFASGTPAGLLAALYVVGLCGLAGVPFAALNALVIPSLLRLARPLEWLRRTDDGARGVAAWGVAGLVGLLPLAGLAWLAGAASHGFAQRALAGPFAALFAIAGASLGVLLAFPVRWWVGRLGPRPWVPVGLASLALLAVVGAVSRLELGAWRLGGYAAAVAGLLLSWVGLWRPLRSRPVTLALVGLTIGGAGGALTGFETSPAGHAVPLRGHLSALATTGLRRLLDQDGDGYAALLAGGDCDDWNPKIGPHMPEIPGNGVDDNCQGGDAQPGDIPLPPAQARVAPRRLNVLVLLLDAVRPDHLGTYGYERATSPNLDAWAKGAVVFERVWAQAPNTPRSIPSMITGRYPSRIAWTDRGANFSDLRPEAETLFEVFAAGGYRTEAQTAHWYFDRASSVKSGVAAWDNRGALPVVESESQTMAHELTPRVVARLEALAAGDAPWLLFAHYFDAHARYLNHPEVRVFGSRMLDRYDSELAFVDHHLGPVFGALERLGLADDTVVVVTSDHGEAFKEHGLHFHGRTLYEEEVRVPLLVKVPGSAGRREAHPVALVDLAQTLAELVGLELPAAQGVSFAPLLVGASAPPPRTVFLEQLPYAMYRKHLVGAVGPAGLKVIRNLSENVTEVFDLGADPGEQKDLLATRPDAAEGLRRALAAFIDGDPGQSR